MTLEIRALGEDDLEEAGHILAAAYGSPRGRERELQRYLAAQPDGWLLALKEGRPAGMGGALNTGACAYLGMMAVLPAFQRQGIGQALLRHILAWLDAHACPTILLDASDAGAPLYARHGFVDAGATLLLQHSGTSLPSASPVETATLRPGNLPAVVSFDATLYGVGRATLLAAYTASYPERAFIVHGPHGAVRGYVVAQARTIRPWAAESPDVAEALLRAALTLPFDESPAVIIPAERSAGVDLLSRHGFLTQRTLRHMVRGRPWRPRSTLYGQASFAVG